jgi:hypothetical protein
MLFLPVFFRLLVIFVRFPWFLLGVINWPFLLSVEALHGPLEVLIGNTLLFGGR